MGIPLKIRERKKNSSWLAGLHPPEKNVKLRIFTSGLVVQPMAKKCTKKRDARVKKVIIINLLLV